MLEEYGYLYDSTSHGNAVNHCQSDVEAESMTLAEETKDKIDNISSKLTYA